MVQDVDGWLPGKIKQVTDAVLVKELWFRTLWED